VRHRRVIEAQQRCCVERLLAIRSEALHSPSCRAQMVII
jgi:hypothetical protein